MDSATFYRRLVPKLCLGTHVPEALLPVSVAGCRTTSSRGDAKQSFAEVRSQAELGNEGRREFGLKDHVTVTLNVCVAVLPVLSVALTVIVDVPAAW